MIITIVSRSHNVLQHRWKASRAGQSWDDRWAYHYYIQRRQNGPHECCSSIRLIDFIDFLISLRCLCAWISRCANDCSVFHCGVRSPFDCSCLRLSSASHPSPDHQNPKRYPWHRCLCHLPLTRQNPSDFGSTPRKRTPTVSCTMQIPAV